MTDHEPTAETSAPPSPSLIPAAVLAVLAQTPCARCLKYRIELVTKGDGVRCVVVTAEHATPHEWMVTLTDGSYNDAHGKVARGPSLRDAFVRATVYRARSIRATVDAELADAGRRRTQARKDAATERAAKAGAEADAMRDLAKGIADAWPVENT